MNTTPDLTSPSGTDDSLFPSPSPSPSPPTSSSRTPRSPKPHLFGIPSTSTPNNTTTATATNTQVLPSDILTVDDYGRLRWKTTERGLLGGLLGGLTTTFLVRRFWPSRPTSKALVLVFFGSGVVGTYYASSRYLMSEVKTIRQRAKDMTGSKSDAQLGAQGFDMTAEMKDPFLGSEHERLQYKR